jgi:hypothetical protein
MKTELLLAGAILGILGLIIGLSGLQYPINVGAIGVGAIMVLIAVPLFFVGLLTTAATEILDHNKPFQPIPQQQIMIMICPVCRSRITTDVNYCPRCGTDLKPIG